MKRVPRSLIAIFGLAMLGLVAGGAALYRAEERQARQEVEQRIATIAKLKADQIAAWQAERLNDAAVLMGRANFVADLSRWLSDPASPTAGRALALFRALDRYPYRDVVLVDPGGVPRLSTSGRLDGLDAEATQALSAALGERRPRFTVLHTHPGGPHIEVVAPLFGDAPDHPPVGALLLQVDPRQYLYPLVQSWPVPSDSAETLLVRRDGNAALILNDLRHLKDAALRVRIPLSDAPTPAALAVLGYQGVAYGRDSRGVQVVSAIVPVPGTPWKLIAKEDEREAFASWRGHASLLLGLILTVCLLAGGTVAVVWQRNETVHYRKMFEAQAARRQSDQRYVTTLLSIGDGVVATDAQARVDLLNPVAEALTGWTTDQARGKPIEEVFRIVNEGTRATVENPVVRVLREGQIVGLANHTLLVCRDGTERPIADSGAPIRDEQGAIGGVVLVFRDQTEDRRTQKILQEREELFRQIFSDGPAVALLYDPGDGRIIDANRAAERFYGWPLDRLRAMRMFDLSTLSAEETAARMREAQSGVVRSFLFRHRLATGEVRDIESFPGPLRIGGRDLVLAIIHDVTERRRAEARSQWLSTIVDHSVNEVFVFDPGTLRFSFANRGALANLGFTLEELRALTPVDIKPTFTPESFERVLEPLRSGQVPQLTLDTIHRRKDGSTYDVLLVLQRIVAEGQDAFVAMGYDITDRKRAEVALRESERRFRTIYDNVPMGVAQISLDFRIEHANPAYCRILGRREEDLVGAHLRDITHPDDLDANLQQQARLARGEIDRYGMEKRVVARDGRIVHGIIGVNLVRDAAGAPAYSLGTLVDVTDRKRADEERERFREQLGQAQKMDLVGRLAGGVAHDFNNMLGVILGNAEMGLEAVGAEAGLREPLEEIRKAAEHSAQLTRQLLAFARKQTIAPTVLDLNQTVAETLKMLARLIREDIELVYRPGEAVWPVKLDPSQINQILGNLLVNARDAITGAGQITVETGNAVLDRADCAGHPGLVPGDYARLTVTDTGCGMDEETADHVFEPFFTTKGLGRGTGLGLATVHGIVRQNDGAITVRSEPGLGTTFHVYVPRHLGETAGTAAPRETPRSGRGETVLLVEDEAPLLRLGKRILEGLGYRVLTAGAPGEALGLFDGAGDVRLLITDVIMPEMNGRELAARLAARAPGLRCLFMSGYTADTIADRGVLDEGTWFIQKPFSAAEFARKVREALDGSVPPERERLG